MAAKISSPVLQNAHDRIAHADAFGTNLAAVVDQRGTRAIFSSLISGGFTLNVIKTTLIQRVLTDLFIPVSCVPCVTSLCRGYSAYRGLRNVFTFG
jgi:hypothetical protein